MRIFKSLFSFYLNSSIHVALAVVSLVIVTQLKFRLPVQQNLLFFTFFGTVTGYNFVKYAGIAKLHHYSLANNIRIIQIFSFLCFLGLIYYASLLKTGTLVLAGTLGLVMLLYVLPVFKGRRNLRAIGGVKVHVIAVIWSGVTVVMPFIEIGSLRGIDVLFEFLQRYIFVLVLLLPFEIRDLRYDKIHLSTIPQRVGVRQTRIFGLILLILFLLLEILQRRTEAETFLAGLLTAAITASLLIKSGEDQPKYFASFWVEGIPIVWFLMLWVVKLNG